MGVFNVIKLANDYAKAKKILASKNIDIKKAKELVEKIKEFIDVLYKYKDELNLYIKEVKDILKKLKEVSV